MNGEQSQSEIKFAYFGSSRFSVIVLDRLLEHGIAPEFIVTTPDKPQGRKLIMTPNVVKQWATEHDVPVYDPAKIDAVFIAKLNELQARNKCDVYVVASYGKIIPEVVLDIPTRKTLNIHPSLLPKYRGPSPLPTAILDDEKNTGITIMRLDREMDHGPIIAQKAIEILKWPTYEEFEEMMAINGASLLAEMLPLWIKGMSTEKEQDHARATYTKKIIKEDALIDLSADPYTNFCKIQAYHEWPQAYFFIKHDGRDFRVKITGASFNDGKLTIERVIPEGGKEMDYADFERGYLHK